MGFLRKLAGIIKHLVTAKDGETYAPSRVYWLLASSQFLILAAYSVMVVGHPFDAVAYGTGMSLILTAGGLGVWLTKKTEPGQ